jgi:hypothetical protein
MVTRRVYVLGCLLLTFSGCGGGSSEQCGAVQPCGGDLLGEWAFVAGCVDDAAISQAGVQGGFCPTAVIENAAMEPSGTLAFQRDMTYSGQLRVTISFDIRFPLSCIQGFTCSQLDAGLQIELVQNPDPAYMSVSCAGTSACTCRFVSLPMEDADSGVYATSGTTLATSNDDGSMDFDEYCVHEDTLHILQLAMPMSMGSMGSMRIASDLVGTRVR